MRPRSLPTMVFTVALVAFTVLLATAGPAHAHNPGQTYVYLEIDNDSIAGRVEFPVEDLNEVLGLDMPDTGNGVDAAVAANADVIGDYAAMHLQMADEAGTTAWPLVFGSDLDVLAERTDAFVSVPFEVDLDFDGVPQRFTVAYDGIIHALPEREAFLLLANDWQAGEFNNEASHLVRFTPENSTQVIDRDASFWKGFVTVVELGAEHIKIGTDHILFVLALVIPAVLVFKRGEGWRPVPTFGQGLWRVTKIATMFTLAHSITLTLGGLGIVSLPTRPVETFIALSIAAAALHNVIPIFVNKEWVLAFCFGLFHGLGFAGLLEDLGLTDSNRFWSLLGFNLGIELGQLLIIFLVFPVLFVLRRTRAYPAVLYGASGALGLAAVGWAAERGFDLPERVNRYVEPVLAWPQAVWYVLVAGVIACVYYRWEASKGVLRSNDDLLPGPAIQRHDSRRSEVSKTPAPDDELESVG